MKFDNPLHDELFFDIDDARIIKKEFNILKDYKPGTRINNKLSYYTIIVKRREGIYHTWKEWREQVNCYQKSTFKKFASEGDASNFIATHHHVRANATQTGHKFPQLLNQLAIILGTRNNEKYDDVKDKENIQQIFIIEVNYFISELQPSIKSNKIVAKVEQTFTRS